MNVILILLPGGISVVVGDCLSSSASVIPAGDILFLFDGNIRTVDSEVPRDRRIVVVLVLSLFVGTATGKDLDRLKDLTAIIGRLGFRHSGRRS